MTPERRRSIPNQSEVTLSNGDMLRLTTYHGELFTTAELVRGGA